MYISMCGALETGFLHKISVRMPKLSQKPGFLDYGSIALQLKNPVPLVPRLCLVTQMLWLRLAQTHQQTLD